MSVFRVALVGFGNVGQGFAEIVAKRGGMLRDGFDIDIRIVAVSDLQKGAVYDPQGLDPEQLLSAVRRDGSLASVSAPERGWDALRTIRESNADAVAELAYTDLRTGEPGFTHMSEALAAGKHVLSSNKGPVALRFPELLDLATRNGVEIGVEGTVMSGTPTLRLGSELLAGAGVTRIRGILNGTTNYILTRMEEGLGYDEALAEAQERGYAEADPSGDVDGHDAAGKVVILANLVMGERLAMKDVAREGISAMTLEMIRQAGEAGERWKLIGDLERAGDGLRAEVRPARLPLAHPLAAVGGATNAVTFTTELLGDVTLVGPGAGRLETGFALLADLLAIHRRRSG